MAKFSKGHNSGKIRYFNQVIRFHSDFIQRGTTPEREITRTRKKTCVKYFSIRNPHMKFQNRSMHGFRRTDARMHGHTNEQPETNRSRQLLRSWRHKKLLFVIRFVVESSLTVTKSVKCILLFQIMRLKILSLLLANSYFKSVKHHLHL